MYAWKRKPSSVWGIELKFDIHVDNDVSNINISTESGMLDENKDIL